MDLKRGIDKAVKAVVDFIAANAEKVDDNYDKIEQVATVSANNDKEIGKLLADAMRKVSKDGVISIEESKSRDTHIEVVEGMQFDRGYLSGYFAFSLLFGEGLGARLQYLKELPPANSLSKLVGGTCSPGMLRK